MSREPSAFLRLWTGVVRILEAFVITLFATLVVVVLWGVVSRYLPGIRPSDWTEEIAIHLLVWLSLLGAPLAYRSHAHLGVDFLTTRFAPSAQRFAAVLAGLVVLGFSAFAMVFGGWQLVAGTLSTGQITPVLQWTAGYLYLAVPLSGLFFCAFAIEHILRPDAFRIVHDPTADI